MIHFWYSISINDTFQMYQYDKSVIHDCDTFTADNKKDSCCELFTRSVRNCESNSINAAYSDKLWSWRRFLWLRHNTINWRSNQCCWQPDRKCINYLSDTGTENAGKIQSISESFRLHQLIAYCSARLDTGQRKVPRRNHLSDSMFEKLSLLKANHSLF